MRADGVRAEKAAATRKLIVTTARKLFSTQGYNGSPIEQIVEEAQDVLFAICEAQEKIVPGLARFAATASAGACNGQCGAVYAT